MNFIFAMVPNSGQTPSLPRFEHWLLPEQISQFRVRNSDGGMVPLGALCDVSESSGPSMVLQYNGVNAAAVNGSSAPGVSSGAIVSVVDSIVQHKLPSGMDSQWTELTFLQIRAGNTAIYVFAIAVVLVFLVLAAQYESLSMPLAVILVVPMCLLCSVAGIAMAGTEKRQINAPNGNGCVCLRIPRAALRSALG